MNVKLFLVHVCPPFLNVMHIYATTQIILFQFLFPVYLKLKYASTSAPIPADVDMSSHVISQCRQKQILHSETHATVRKGERRPRSTPFLKVKAEVFVVHDNRLQAFRK